MNLTEAKLSQKRIVQLKPRVSTSDPFKPQAETDYENRKEKEKKDLHDEIYRISKIDRLI